MVAPADGGAPEHSLWSTSDHVHINGWQADGKLLYLNLRTGSNENIATYSFEDGQVRLSVMGERRLRAVTHLDVSRKQVDAAVEAMARALQAKR